MAKKKNQEVNNPDVLTSPSNYHPPTPPCRMGALNYALLHINQRTTTAIAHMGERRSFRKNASLISDKLVLHRRNVFSNLRCEDARASGGFLAGNGAKHSGAAQASARTLTCFCCSLRTLSRLTLIPCGTCAKYRSRPQSCEGATSG